MNSVRKTQLTYLLLVLFFVVQAKSTTEITHYSVTDGLSENHILAMLQDKNGIMWFGTFNGLNRFDGYSFSSFNGRQDQKTKLSNFRIDRIVEDQQGFLWLQTDDSRIYRFDTGKERFLPIPQCLDDFKNFDSPINRIELLSDGSIWLFNRQDGNQPCLRVNNTNQTDQIRVEKYKLGDNDPDFRINSLFQDDDGNTWFITSDGIAQIKSGRTEIDNFNVFSGVIFSFLEKKNQILFGCEKGNLLIYDKKKRTFDLKKIPRDLNVAELFSLGEDEIFLFTNSEWSYILDQTKGTYQEFQLNGFGKTKILGACQDKEKNVWIDTDKPGAVFWDAKTRKMNYMKVDTTGKYFNYNSKFTLIEDDHRNRWILTHKSGLLKFNESKITLDPVVDPKDDKFGINTLPHVALVDRQGNLWLNTYMQGIDKIVFKEQPFQFTKSVNTPYYNPENEVRSVFEDSRHQLWAGTRNGSVLIYDENRNLKGYLAKDGRLKSRNAFTQAVYDIKEDHAGNIWLATRGEGIFRLTPNADQTYHIVNFRYNKEDIFSLSNDDVYSIFEDHERRIWIATWGGGLNLLQSKDGKIAFINSRNQLANYPSRNCSKLRFLTEDQKGMIYAGTTGGLLVFQPRNLPPEKIDFENYAYDPEGTNSILGNDVHNVLTLKNGDVYITTIGGGVNFIKGGIVKGRRPIFETLDNVDGNSISSVYTIRNDSKGNIWMSAQTQIYKYVPSHRKTEIFRPVTDGKYFISEAAACRTFKGGMIYGSSNGFMEFDPLKIKKSNYVPQIIFTQLQLPNGSIQISGMETVSLDADQNNFSIEFAAIDHENPDGVQYAYKMEGLESDWNYVGNQRVARYNNFPMGKYLFKVRSTNADGLWVENVHELQIVKKPGFWESSLGNILVILLFILLTFIVVYVLFTIFRLRNEVDVEHRISNMKMRFFTDISHELRTPLTLIATPVENLLAKENLPEKVGEQLEIVKRNTDRMLRLINQILDFRKIQNNKMNMIVEEVKVPDYVREICVNFSKYADEKNIRLNIIDQSNQAKLWLDKDKFEKIMYNLVSNALKYSGNDKAIDILLFEDIDTVSITVKDQGVGISRDRMKYLFERFESFTAKNISAQSGTGIGLSLTRELVDLHQAKITVDSVAGKGSTFTIHFKKGKDHFDKKTEFVLEDPDNKDSYTGIQRDEPMHPTEEYKEEKYSILIAEDNDELRSFLRSALSGKYTIIEAVNGNEACEKAFSYVPDLIISDLMMPEKDGIEFAETIKKDINTSHIPFIMLTAITDLESKLEAMKLCVDDYITKPFSLTFVEARIENLLNIRIQLQSYFKSSLTSGVITLLKPEITNLDEVFITKTMHFLEGNYDNSELNIDDISNEVGVSRSSFYNKIKGLTGLAPVDFVREYRLQKAVQLIEAGETRINQIAFTVGINDSKYFSRCFKKKFGVNPSDYKYLNTGQNIS